MKKYTLFTTLTIILLIFANPVSYAQQGNIWTFGVGASIDFAGGASAGTSSISTFEGCASIADNGGNLLFYTDGINIWDGSNSLVTTGLLGHPSAAQSGIVIPVPGSPTDYYVVSIPQRASERARYTRITTSGGVSVVGVLNNTLPDHAIAAFTTEGMTVATHCNGTDYWLITHEMGNNRFKSYQVTSTGFLSPVLSDVGPIVASVGGNDPNVNSAACMKISRSNVKLGFVIRQTGVNLFDFAPATGVISNHVPVLLPTATPAFTKYYGVEFSPNSDILYYTDLAGGLYSYDIITPTLNTLASTVGISTNLYGALQFAPDGNIYMAKDGDPNMGNLNQTTLGVISNPDNFTLATFNSTGFALAPGTACKVGLPNIVPALTVPQLAISGNTQICLGESTTLIASGGANYTWSPSSGLNTSSGSTVIATPTSTTTYTVTSTQNGCSLTEDVTVIVENCCPLLTTPPADLVNHPINEVISSDTYWSGTHYIGDNVIITVDNDAILDITNVDVIFGNCAGIDFTNGASLRSNNSVYRTCETNDIWRGLEFYAIDGSSSPTAIINECTFKNAERAIFAHDQDVIDVRITNNLLSNCLRGVVLNNGTVIRSISGNTFLLDDMVPDYVSAPCAVNDPQQFVGVESRSVQFTESIAQNDFIIPDYTIPNYVGVKSTMDRDLSVHANNFSNVFRSVYLNRARNAKIESNEINVTHSFSGYEHQISSINGISILIGNNTIVNSSQYAITSWAGNNSAIYCNLGQSYDIKENQISGFETGIQCENVTNIHVTDNDVNNCHFYGIYFNNLRSAKASCNSINMEKQPNVNAIGLGYFSNIIAANGNELMSNCIYETNTAIHLEGTNAMASDLPVIQNNYLYNYSDFGVEAINTNGNIGSSSSPALGAGRNSFISNNGLALTGDIVSSNSLTSFGNFGVSFVSGNISISGNNVNSTASCGQQIDLPNSSGGYMEICDDLSDVIIAFVGNGNQLKSNFSEAIQGTRHADLINVLHKVSNSSNTQDLTIFYEAVIQTGTLTENQLKWFVYNYYILQSENSEALNVLNSIVTQDQEELNLINLERIQLTSNAINGQELSELEAISNSESQYAHLAVALLVDAGIISENMFYKTRDPIHLEKSNIVEIESAVFNVYPNPTNGEISFEYSIGEEENGVLLIFDLTGKKLAEINLDYQRSIHSLDFSEFSEGVYSLSIQSNGKVIAHSKLIKL